MKTNIKQKAATTLTIMAIFAGLVLTSGCILHRPVRLRYTPIAQTQRLADKTTPQTAIVGKFTDARPHSYLAVEHFYSIHTFIYDSVYDVPTLVRSAFVDALLKSGFNVSMQTESAASPFLQITGKVFLFHTSNHAGWSTITETADVGVELTVVPKSGSPVTITVQGQGKKESKDEMDLGIAIQDTLDRALQDCAKKFLENETFLLLLKN